MSLKIVAISVDKIQRYVYQRIDDMTSQGLNDNNTLSEILLASKEVKEGILEEINKVFGNKGEENKIEIEEYILKISGKYIFKVKTDKEEKLKSCLKELFEKVYKKYHGQLFLRYKYFDYEEVDNKIEYIRKSSEYWKSPKVKSEVIEQNKEIIFNFMELEGKSRNQKVNNLKNNSESEKEIFVKNLDDLAPINRNDKEKEGNEKNNIKTRGKIAIVKADINNMGSIMGNINSYEKYQELSKLLTNMITLEKFSEKVEEFNLENKILPFYVEGDDIFFAVKIGSLLESIKLLKSWIDELREKIKNEKIGDKINITISVGATFVDNHQPVRYYRKVVEEELSIAKYKMKEEKVLVEDKTKEKCEKAILGISISGVSLFYYNGEKGKGENDGFYAFEKNVKKLNLFNGNTEKGVKEISLFNGNKFFSNSYFYNLLYSIEHERDKNHQIETLLYKLLPNITGETRRKKTQDKNDEKMLENNKKRNRNEIYFKYYLINQIIEMKDKAQKNDRPVR